MCSDELASIDGIPVTGISRTILDLAAILPPSRVERAINEAEFRQLTDKVSLPELIDRYPGRRGVAV